MRKTKKKEDNPFSFLNFTENAPAPSLAATSPPPSLDPSTPVLKAPTKKKKKAVEDNPFSFFKSGDKDELDSSQQTQILGTAPGTSTTRAARAAQRMQQFSESLAKVSPPLQSPPQTSIPPSAPSQPALQPPLQPPPPQLPTQLPPPPPKPQPSVFDDFEDDDFGPALPQVVPPKQQRAQPLPPVEMDDDDDDDLGVHTSTPSSKGNNADKLADLSERIEYYKEQLVKSQNENVELKMQYSRKLRENEEKVSELQKRLALTEQKFIERAKKEAVETKAMEVLTQQIEEKLKQTTLRAQQAEQTVSSLEKELTQYRMQAANMQAFPNWEAVKEYMEQQTQQINSARERSKAAATELTNVLKGAGGHLMELAKNAKALKDIVDVLGSLDRVLEATVPPPT